MSTWIVLIIALLVGILIAIVIWVTWPQQTKVSGAIMTGVGLNTGIGTKIVGYGHICNTMDTLCDNGLVCEGTCVKALGQTCNSNSECTNRATGCNGVCYQTLVGAINQTCPCSEPLTQSVYNGTVCTCKGSIGHTCDNNNDCASQICDPLRRVCIAGRSIGQTCLPGQCDTGLSCSEGFCQTTGQASGAEGAVCSPGQLWPPRQGQTLPGCSVSLGLTCLDGICRRASHQLGSICGPTSGCAAPLVCRGNLCQYPENPNQCDETSQCGPGQTCVANICVSHSGQPCAIDSNCMGSPCSRYGKMFRWDSMTLSWVLHSNTAIPITRLAIGPNGQLIGISITDNATTDGIYAFDGGSWNLIPQTGIWHDRRESDPATYYYRLIDATANSMGIYGIYNVIAGTESMSTNIGNGIFKISSNGQSPIPLNTTTGVHLDASGQPIVAVGLDVNPRGDILVSGAPSGSTNQYIYVIPFGTTNGRATIALGGDPCATNILLSSSIDLCRPRWYSAGNVSDTDRLQQFAYLRSQQSQGRVVRFSGEFRNATLPVSSTNEVFDTTDFSIIVPDGQKKQIRSVVVSRDADSGSFRVYIVGVEKTPGALFGLPGYFSGDSRVLATTTDIFIWAPQTCE